MRIDVLGVGFDNLTLAEAAKRGMELLHTEGTHYVVTPNPEIVEICREDPAGRQRRGAGTAGRHRRHQGRGHAGHAPERTGTRR